MFKTYFDNSPERPGVQLLLNIPLTPAEELVIAGIKSTHYEIEMWKGKLEDCWIVCDKKDKQDVINLLLSFGYKSVK